MKHIFVVVLMVGCVQMPNGGGQDKTTGQQSVVSVEINSGTRLRVGYLTSTDGLKYPSGNFWDSQLNSVCRPTVTDAMGGQSCLPQFVVHLWKYADSNCTQIISEPSDNETEIVIAMLTSNKPYYRLMKVGEHYTGTRAYTGSDPRSGGTCYPGGNPHPNDHFLEDITNTLVRVEESFQ